MLLKTLLFAVAPAAFDSNDSGVFISNGLAMEELAEEKKAPEEPELPTAKLNATASANTTVSGLFTAARQNLSTVMAASDLGQAQRKTLQNDKTFRLMATLTMFPAMPLTSILVPLFVLTSPLCGDYLKGKLEKIGALLGLKGMALHMATMPENFRRYGQWIIWTLCMSSSVGFWGTNYYLAGGGKRNYRDDALRLKYFVLSKVAMSVYTVGVLLTVPALILDCFVHEATMNESGFFYSEEWRVAVQPWGVVYLTLWSGQLVWAAGFWIMYGPIWDMLWFFVYPPPEQCTGGLNLPSLHSAICANGARCDLHTKKNGGLKCCEQRFNTTIARCPTYSPVLCQTPVPTAGGGGYGQIQGTAQYCLQNKRDCTSMPGGVVIDLCELGAAPN